MRSAVVPNPISINSFLKLGYFIEYGENRFPINFSGIDKGRYASSSRAQLLEAGIQALRATFAETFERDRDHVVPLSGGLDSRLILCALRELTEARNISTYTYGIPGSYDYEIGALVAKRAGTKHLTLPMNRITYHADELVEVAKREDCQAFLFFNPPIGQLAKLFGGCLFWSGYVGDAVAGSHLHDPPSATLDEAKRAYLKNRTFVRSVRLHACSDADFLPHVGGGRLPPEHLTWDEQVLFDEGVSKFTVAHALWKGFDYKTPLINTRWMDFMFSVPNEYRTGERLMIDIGRSAFPGLFDLPSRNQIGHDFSSSKTLLRATFWLNRARKLAHQFVPAINWPNIQYNDFGEAIRNNPDVRSVVLDSIAALRKRGLCDWIDTEALVRRHDSRLRNHSDALIVLASLELVLQARAERAEQAAALI